MTARKVAITGAAGQIGSALTSTLLHQEDVAPVAIVRNPIGAGLIEHIAPGCEVRVGSITDPDSARQLLGDCDAVVHCALATVSRKPQASRRLNRAMVDNIGRIETLETAVFLSTVSVYGATYTKDRRFPGTFERPRPDNEYGRSKLELEHLVERAWSGKQRFTLRVGHVIGGNFDHSRSIAELAAEDAFKLPFDGTLPSNTVHIDSLTAQILPLLMNPVASGTFNAVDEARSWREVFDWHTNTLGLPRVAGLPEDVSKGWRRQFSRSSVPRDVMRWAGSVGVLDLVRFPAVQQALTRSIRLAPESRIDELATWYKKRFVAKQVGEAMATARPEVAPLLVSDAVPGRSLVSAIGDRMERPSDIQMQLALSRWAERALRATWLPKDSGRLPEHDAADAPAQMRHGGPAG